MIKSTSGSTSGPTFGFTRDELRIFSRLNTAVRIQQFLDESVGYNLEKDGETCRSPRRVLGDRLAHCAEGAYFAAAALRLLGRPPLIIDLVAVRDDDHLLAAYKEDGCWGAIAKSNYSGLRFRQPVFRSVRELVMSYHPHYFNLSGELSLRSYSAPVNLTRFDPISWMTTEEHLLEIGDYFYTVRHFQVLPSHLERRRLRADSRLFEAGFHGAAS